MENLNFSRNWNNKLDCEVFSTIRLWNKDIHYEGRVVFIYDQSVSPPRYKGRGVYLVVSQFKLDQLKPGAAWLDTGYSLEETLNILRTMYKNKVANLETQPFAYIIIKKVKEIPK